jgi:endoglycosylceramidase
VIYKIWPFIPSQGKFDPQNSLNTEDMENLQKWGVNLVRLGVMWESVESAPGTSTPYNTTYLTELKALVDKLGTYGIYTMLDAHQDVVSRSTCGEGFPDYYAAAINSTCGDWSDPAFDDIKIVDTDCMTMYDYDYIRDK